MPGPFLDLTDHQRLGGIIWASIRLRVRLDADLCRAIRAGDPLPDPRTLADPSLDNDELIAQMQASIAGGF